MPQWRAALLFFFSTTIVLIQLNFTISLLCPQTPLCDTNGSTTWPLVRSYNQEKTLGFPSRRQNSMGIEAKPKTEAACCGGLHQKIISLSTRRTNIMKHMITSTVTHITIPPFLCVLSAWHIRLKRIRKRKSWWTDTFRERVSERKNLL